MSEQVRVDVVTRRPMSAERTAVLVFGSEVAHLQPLPAAEQRLVRQLQRRATFRRDEGGTAEAALDDGKRALAAIDLGPSDSFDERRLDKLLERLARESQAAGVRSVAILVPEHDRFAGEEVAARIARALALATYRFGRHEKPGRTPLLRTAHLVVPAAWRKSYSRGAEFGTALAAGVAFARDLANTPPNEATPDWMSRQARAAAKRWGARISVLGPAELRRRRMGGLLAVGGGSENPPRMVRLEMGRGPRTVALVGKGVTFDTGGISIKPAGQMDEMKWDKCGACAVLGIFEALSRLDLRVRVRAYLPFAENMPDGKAYRPGDIVRCANGKTVEILNTDAEGRMILADALSWAAEEKPDDLLEFSTLTGACVVALGPTGAGLFTPSDELATSLLAAAGDAGERLWRLPLWPEFLDEMRGSHADLRNSGGRWGGASTAAAFLSQFVSPVSRWAHLDIAGPAYVGGDSNPKRGATGYGVALTVDWLRRLAGD
ncbi:MAG: M17 family metallopeptidase [Thermoanaerobaculia bacterium]